LRALALACALLAGCDQQLRFDEPSAASSAQTSASCERDEDCNLSTLHCDVVSGACVACRDDNDCTDHALPRCDAALHRCVNCGSDSDCDPSQTCLPRTRTCVVRCAEGAMEKTCPADAPTCDEVARICVQCKTDPDCLTITDDGPYCEAASGRCVHCTDDRQCPATHPRCDDVQHRCGECSTGSDCPPGSACDPVALRCI
jgi:hypothetical protein